MNNKKSLPFLLTSIIATIFLVMASSVLAQDDVEVEMQTITIAATEDGLVVPETVDAGWVEIIYENNTENPFYTIIGRLDEEATMDEFVGTLFAAMGGISNDAPPATLIGGPLTLPEEAQTAIYNLEAGTYVLLSVVGEQPEFTAFVVEGDMDEADIEFEVALTIPLADFVFGLPSELVAGEQIWQIENRGEQWHEMIFIPVSEGTTMDDAMMMASAGEEGEDVAPDFTGIPYAWSPMSEGENALLQVDLSPGTYLISCFVPDTSAEEALSHAEMGMMQIIIVTETEE